MGKADPEKKELVTKINLQDISDSIRSGLYYTGTLETYPVSWSIEKCARDVWQNFFDGNDLTLDGVVMDIKKHENTFTIKIQNHANYDFRELLHFGGTTKSKDDSTAGYFGEGTKVAGLVLLRDYDFSQVKFASRDWILEYLLQKIPEELYRDERKGLFAKFELGRQVLKGNYIEFKVDNEDYVKAFVKAKDLFFHSKNKDFKKPTINISSVGGFKYLPRKKGSDSTPLGNLYINGQRRHFDKEEWNTVENFNIWVWNDTSLPPDRDRGAVNIWEIDKEIIPRIIESAETKDLIKAFYEMEDLWGNEVRSSSPGYKILYAIAKRLEKEEVKLKFDDKYLSSSLGVSRKTERDFGEANFTIGHSFLKNVGMTTSEKAYTRISKTYLVEPTPIEQEKINILYEVAQELERKPRKIILTKDKMPFRSGGEQTNENLPVRIERKLLKHGFAPSLAVYLHETDHDNGLDGSREFSDALTDTIEVISDRLTQPTDKYQKLRQRWENLKYELKK